MTSEIKVCGKLAKILSHFEAPKEVQTKIAKRAGGVIPNEISHEQVEDVILEHMEGGFPEWGVIFDRLGEAASRIYKGKKAFR